MKTIARCLVVAMAAFGVAAQSAEAQWSQVGGDFGVTFGYQTNGRMSCTLPYSPANMCTTDPTLSKFTLQSGSAFAEVSFTGTTGSITALPHSSQVLLGTLHVRTGGTGPFSWPASPIANYPLFQMRMDFDILDGPGASSMFWDWGYKQTAPGTLQGYQTSSYLGFELLPLPYPQPSFLNYHNLIFTAFDAPDFGTTDADYEMTADVGLIPEPGTYALMTFGLAALGIAARRRKAQTPAVADGRTLKN